MAPHDSITLPFTESTPLRVVARAWVEDLAQLIARDPEHRLRSPSTLTSRRYSAAMLEDAPASGPSLADRPIGEITPRQVREHLRRVAEARGLCPHALRRAFAEHAIAAGDAPADVAFCLGHRKLDTLLRYAGAALPPGAFAAAERLRAQGKAGAA